MTVENLFKLYAYILRRFAEGVLQLVLFTVMLFKWSVKKMQCSENLSKSIFIRKKCNCISYKVSYKFVRIALLSHCLSKNKKEDSNFKKVSNELFVTSRRHAEFSIFQRGIFSHTFLLLLQLHYEMEKSENMFETKLYLRLCILTVEFNLTSLCSYLQLKSSMQNMISFH